MKFSLLALLLLPAAAVAQMAIDVGYQLGRIPGGPVDEGFNLPSLDLGMLDARFSYFVTPWVALEGSVGTGVKDDANTLRIQMQSIGYTVKYDYGAAALVKFWMPLSGLFSIHGLWGYQWIRTSTEALGERESASNDEGLYGVGGEVHLFSNIWLRGDWMQTADDSGTDLYRIAVSYRFR